MAGGLTHRSRNRWSLLLSMLVGLVPISINAEEYCGDLAETVVQVLGAGGPELTDRLSSTSYLVWRNGRARLLIDTGPGASVNFERAGARFEDLQAIVYTHLHVDHSAALAGFVKGAYFSSRDRDLPIFGPTGNSLLPSTVDFVERLFGPDGLYPYLADVLATAENSGAYQLKPQSVEPDGEEVRSVPLTKEITLSATTAHHGPLPALAWRVDVADASIVFTGDTTNRDRGIQRLGSNIDLLVAHNAIPESAEGFATGLHMRPSDIADIARMTRPKQLLLSHFMTRSIDSVKETTGIIHEQQPSGVIRLAEELGCYPLG